MKNIFITVSILLFFSLPALAEQADDIGNVEEESGFEEVTPTLAPTATPTATATPTLTPTPTSTPAVTATPTLTATPTVTPELVSQASTCNPPHPIGQTPDYCTSGNTSSSNRKCSCRSCGECNQALQNNACDIVELTANITSGESCITIDNPNKTFNCLGHSIIGLNPLNLPMNFDYNNNFEHFLSYERKGISVTSQNVTIKNCTVKNWPSGIRAEGRSDPDMALLVDNVTASENFVGLVLDEVRYATVKNGNFDNNQISGGENAMGGYRNCYMDNTFNNNQYYGFKHEDSQLSYVRGNEFSGNGRSGLKGEFSCNSTTPAIVEDNIFRNNVGAGLEIQGTGGTIRGNDFSGGGKGIDFLYYGGTSPNQLYYNESPVTNILSNTFDGVEGAAINANNRTQTYIANNGIKNSGTGISIGAASTGGTQLYQNRICGGTSGVVVANGVNVTQDSSSCR